MPQVKEYHTAAVSTAVSQIVAYNKLRTGLLIKNYSGNLVFISNSQVNLPTQGFPLAVGDYLDLVARDGDVPEEAVYAVANATTADLRIVEAFGEVAP